MASHRPALYRGPGDSASIVVRETGPGPGARNRGSDRWWARGTCRRTRARSERAASSTRDTVADRPGPAVCETSTRQPCAQGPHLREARPLRRMSTGADSSETMSPGQAGRRPVATPSFSSIATRPPFGKGHDRAIRAASMPAAAIAPTISSGWSVSSSREASLQAASQPQSTAGRRPPVRRRARTGWEHHRSPT